MEWKPERMVAGVFAIGVLGLAARMFMPAPVQAGPIEAEAEPVVTVLGRTPADLYRCGSIEAEGLPVLSIYGRSAEGYHQFLALRWR